MFADPITQRKLLLEKEHKIVFYNLKDLIVMHQIMLSSMVKESNKVNGCIAQVFLIYKDEILDHYAAYSTNFKLGLQTLTERISQSSSLKQYVNDPSLYQKCEKQSIHSLLLMPVQRVPRYILLLQSLLKQTRRKDEKFDTIKIALTTLYSVMNKVNEHVGENDRMVELIQIEEQLSGVKVKKD
jgi:CII-binding regulator of phage lambda lysogenization HflD